jgi:WD40 repeat protein
MCFVLLCSYLVLFLLFSSFFFLFLCLGHTDWIFALCLMSHGLLSCSRDATVRLWSPSSFACLRVVSTSGSRALSVVVQGSLAAVALGNNRVALLDLAADTKPLVLSGEQRNTLFMVCFKSSNCCF